MLGRLLEVALSSLLVPVGNAIAKLIAPAHKAMTYTRTADRRWIAHMEGYRAMGDTRYAASQRVMWSAKSGAMPNDF